MARPWPLAAGNPRPLPLLRASPRPHLPSWSLHLSSEPSDQGHATWADVDEEGLRAQGVGSLVAWGPRGELTPGLPSGSVCGQLTEPFFLAFSSLKRTSFLTVPTHHDARD